MRSPRRGRRSAGLPARQCWWAAGPPVPARRCCRLCDFGGLLGLRLFCCGLRCRCLGGAGLRGCNLGRRGFGCYDLRFGRFDGRSGLGCQCRSVQRDDSSGSRVGAGSASAGCAALQPAAPAVRTANRITVVRVRRMVMVLPIERWCSSSGQLAERIGLLMDTRVRARPDGFRYCKQSPDGVRFAVSVTDCFLG